MADGDLDAQHAAPSGGGDGHRNRLLLWAGFALLLVGVGAGVVIVLALGGGDDSATKVAAGEEFLVTSSTRVTTTIAGSSGTSATAATGGGGRTGGASTPTSPPTTPATAAPPPTTGARIPTVLSASVEPNFVVCPKFGGETTVTVTYETANAGAVSIGFVGVDGRPGGAVKGEGAKNSAAISIPCNGKQQQLILQAFLVSAGEGETGPPFNVFVNEGIEGT
jgi:hypothetical protein